MNGVIPFFRRTLRHGAVWIPAVAAVAAVARLAAVEFVDQRYQKLLHPGCPPVWSWMVAVLLLAAVTFGGIRLLRSRAVADGREPETTFFFCVAPLLPLAVFWWAPMFYGGILLVVFLFALVAGRFFSLLRPAGDGSGSVRHAAVVLSAAVALYAAWGAYMQYRSYSLLAMQWLDWGHYYEALLNTWRGRFFHLNINHGCFLGSRFCPSLLILSPVLPAGVPGFFFAGSLAVASGAWLVYALAREFRASPAEALFFGLWYLLLPGTVNLNLPLLDGFHEVFLLFPAALGALLAYVRRRYLTAWALVIFCFGVRETAVFMFLGFSITLFLIGRRRHAFWLMTASAVALVLIFGVLMPLARPEGTVYSHVVFYPHLGDTMWEIALSPLLRPAAFWGTVFSVHSLWYFAALLLPFLFLAFIAPAWLFPLGFDLVMVAADHRFDSQTLLRHYQCAMLITLVAASLEGFRRLRAGEAPRYAEWFLFGLRGARPAAGIMAATLAATLGVTLFFTQVPGLPGSDPRLSQWSDARDFVRGIIARIEPGAEVTAGPRLASFLVGTHETFFDYDGSFPLRRYVLIESFVSTYNEHRFRRELLRSPEWTLLASEYLDERLVQLFEHRPRREPLPRNLERLSAAEWSAAGLAIPSGMPQLELKAGVSGSRLEIAARLTAPVDFDIGFSLKLKFHDAPDAVFFDSFGHGLCPADFASPGEVYRFSVPLPGRLKSCSVDLIRIP